MAGRADLQGSLLGLPELGGAGVRGGRLLQALLRGLECGRARVAPRG
jgi:hypothetical protein